MELFAQNAPKYELYFKIIKLDRKPDEELIIGDRRILCKVYEVGAMSKGITVYSGMKTEPYYVIQDVFQKTWISNDVPFGMVKADGKIITHLGAEELGVKKKPLETTFSAEIVEFQY